MDIALRPQLKNGLPLEFDIALEAGDLLPDTTLTTAIFLSLFCDRRAHAADPLLHVADKRGCWMDGVAGNATPTRQLGSRLWLLGRAKQLPENLRRAEDYAREALQWLIEEGYADSVTVAAYLPNRHAVTGWMLMQIEIALNKGLRRLRFGWNDSTQAWQLDSEEWGSVSQ